MRKLIYPLIAATATAIAVAILALPEPGLAQQEPRAADATPAPYNPTLGDLIESFELSPATSSYGSPANRKTGRSPAMRSKRSGSLSSASQPAFHTTTAHQWRT